MSRSKQVPTKPARRWPWFVALAVVLLPAVAVRIWAAQDGFWLDEAWSLLYYAEPAGSPLGVFTGPPESNNHHLITLWMYLCGMQDNWVVYRIPSLLAGVATLVLIWHIARQWGEREALASLLLAAPSFVLITYASEARGYALAGCLALVAYQFLKQHLAARSWTTAVAFGLTVCLGFMTHLTFVFFYAGAWAWSLLTFGRAAKSPLELLGNLARCHGLAMVSSAAFYLVSLRGYTVTGAPEYGVWDMTARTLALAVGGRPGALALVIPWALLTLVVIGLGLWWLWRERNDQWLFFAVTIVLGPAVFVVGQSSAVIERFFYISIVFFMILAGYVLGRIARYGHWGQAVALGLILLTVIGNTVLTVPFLRWGRGDYLAAFEYMRALSETPEIRLGSDHDFCTECLTRYYTRRFSDRKFVYYRETGQPLPIDWVITYGDWEHVRPTPMIVDRFGNAFDLRRVYPQNGLSGTSWALYRKRGS